MTSSRKDIRDMTPYERGFLAGSSRLYEGEYPDEDAYYRNLSQEDQGEYDLGWYDGVAGFGPREEEPSSSS